MSVLEIKDKLLKDVRAFQCFTNMIYLTKKL